MDIYHLKHHEIDKPAYDRCIWNSCQGVVYAMSWYLDSVSPGWELLATKGYEFVMPIPVKKQFGFRCSVQPVFCQQLGVFSNRILMPETVIQFINRIPYSYYRLQLNSGNAIEIPKTYLRQNNLLDLGQPYDEILKKYGSNCRKNLKKAESSDLRMGVSTDPASFFGLLVKDAVYRPMIRLIPVLDHLIQVAQTEARVEIRNVRNAAGDILSCILLIYWKNRIYTLVQVSTALGKQQHGMTFLIDRLIRQHAGSDGSVLDFEGSSIPNIARFNAGFGATQESYALITAVHFFKKKLNQLRIMNEELCKDTFIIHN